MAATFQRDYSDETITVQYYVCSVIDVLGQQTKLAGWSKLQADAMQNADFLKSLKSTVGSVEGIEQAFQEYFNKFSESRIPDDLLAKLNPNQQTLFRNLRNRARDCTFERQQFSDTFVFFSPMLNAHGDYAVEALYRMLTACCMAMIFGLASKVPLRGGLCIGTGLKLRSGNFYGPALASAHHIESKVADYPRIVVSSDVLEFARSNGGFSSEPLVNANLSDLAGVCKSLLWADEDGNIIVDFLGDGFRKILGTDARRNRDAVQTIADFVRDEVARFEAQGNQKLISRYRKLQQYVDLRLPGWK